MGAILDALHHLQKIERNLSRFRAKEESFRRQARKNQKQIEKLQSEYEAHLQGVQRCQMEIDNADLDIKAREESMNKHRLALNSAKTNKEYAAVLTALNTEKADAAKFESRVLELMTRKEQLQGQSKEFELERSRLEKRLARCEQDLAKYIEATRADCQRLEDDRALAAEKVPPSALQTFQRVAAKHEGEAMAEVLKLSSRSDDHVCEGCNMSVPLEHINRLKSADDLLMCATCGRILYLEHENGQLR